ncbi:MAG: hypothetical protein Q8K26_00205 [Candidatus Gracilibacteria bacterium]|nr:hypothetical protein [Candidatus Gracilibacteria bacterium]
MTAVLERSNPINEHISSLWGEVYFEYDNEVSEYCVFFKNIDGYYGQGRTKNEAFLELMSGYLSTNIL